MWRRKTTRANWCTSHDRPLDSDGRCEADKELEERMDGKKFDRKFKVGDRVKVKRRDASDPRVNDGDTGRITEEAFESVFRVRMDAPRTPVTLWLFETPDLELVDEQPATGEKFKVGDRVKVRHCSSYYSNMCGNVIEVDPIRETLVALDEGSAAWIPPIDLELVKRPGTFKLDGVDLSSYETVALEDLVDVLNPNDPFERVIMDMVATNRRKRADYAVDGSPWSNFDDTANALGIDGFTPVDSVNFNIEQKSARLRSLRKNGRMQDPRNESVTDTYLDRAVYSVIALAMHTYPTGKVETTEEDAA